MIVQLGSLKVEETSMYIYELYVRRYPVCFYALYIHDDDVFEMMSSSGVRTVLWSFWVSPHRASSIKQAISSSSLFLEPYKAMIQLIDMFL